jgi:hydroxymethylbilane synthase
MIRLGTRGSLLARTQSERVAARLRGETGEDVELVLITTHGDVTSGPLTALGGTGVFATALREALLAGECDLIVHSLKDLPNAPYPGLVLAAVPERASAADVLVTRDGSGLASLAAGARVGSGSPRREAQLRRARPDLVVDGIRGNVDTRVGKVDSAEYDATVLAEAGLRRIGRDARIAEAYALSEWPTSAGQGALAVELREGDLDSPLGRAVRAINDVDAEARALAERAILARLEAGCAAPVGITVHDDSHGLRVVAEVYSLDGARSARVDEHIEPAEITTADRRARLAARVVDDLHARGAADLQAETA